MRRRLLLAVATTAVVSAAPVTGVRAAQPLRYVALGDSYSAGSGLTPADPTAVPECLRSTRNYGHLIARSTHAAYVDRTCAGATNRHMFVSQRPGQPAQLDAVHHDTQLVTLSIGFNDHTVFSSLIDECSAAGTSTGGTGSPCRDEYGDSFVRTIDTTTYRATLRTLRAIRARAPYARIAILSYPWIMPRTGGCYPRMPIATGDVPYVRGVQAAMNAEVGRAAKAVGVRYVNLNRVSDGHDACRPRGVRWIEPVHGSTNPVVVHPNALGERRMAAQVMKVLRLHR